MYNSTLVPLKFLFSVTNEITSDAREGTFCINPYDPESSVSVAVVKSPGSLFYHSVALHSIRQSRMSSFIFEVRTCLLYRFIFYLGSK
jgi:hypothetical protein